MGLGLATRRGERDAAKEREMRAKETRRSSLDCRGVRLPLSVARSIVDHSMLCTESQILTDLQRVTNTRPLRRRPTNTRRERGGISSENLPRVKKKQARGAAARTAALCGAGSGARVVPARRKVAARARPRLDLDSVPSHILKEWHTRCFQIQNFR